MMRPPANIATLSAKNPRPRTPAHLFLSENIRISAPCRRCVVVVSQSVRSRSVKSRGFGDLCSASLPPSMRSVRNAIKDLKDIHPSFECCVAGVTDVDATGQVTRAVRKQK